MSPAYQLAGLQELSTVAVPQEQALGEVLLAALLELVEEGRQELRVLELVLEEVWAELVQLIQEPSRCLAA